MCVCVLLFNNQSCKLIEFSLNHGFQSIFQSNGDRKLWLYPGTMSRRPNNITPPPPVPVPTPPSLTQSATSFGTTLEVLKAQKLFAHRKSASDDTHCIAVEQQVNRHIPAKESPGSERKCHTPNPLNVLTTGSLSNLYDEQRRSQILLNPTATTTVSLNSCDSITDTLNSNGGSSQLQIGVAIGAASAIASSIIAHGVQHSSNNNTITNNHNNHKTYNSIIGGLKSTNFIQSNNAYHQRHLSNSVLPNAQTQLFTTYTTSTLPKPSKVSKVQ